MFSCIKNFNEHISSFLEVVEGEVNVETDEFFDIDIFSFVNGEWRSLLNYILEY